MTSDEKLEKKDDIDPILTYGPSKGQPIITKPVSFNPLGISGLNNNININMNMNHHILAQKSKESSNNNVKQINQYPYWPPYKPEYQQNIVYHPLGWPIDPNYPYQISNYLTTNNVNNINNPTNNINNLLNQYFNTNLSIFNNTNINNNNQFTLFVFHLPPDIDNHGLLHLFRPFGAIQSNVITHDNGTSRGYGFVQFNSKPEAQIAIDMMNGYQIGKKRLKVTFKKDNQK